MFLFDTLSGHCSFTDPSDLTNSIAVPVVVFNITTILVFFISLTLIFLLDENNYSDEVMDDHSINSFLKSRNSLRKFYTIDDVYL